MQEDQILALQKENAELKQRLAQYEKGENVNISELKIPINCLSEVTAYLSNPGERVVKVLIVAEKY